MSNKNDDRVAEFTRRYLNVKTLVVGDDKMPEGVMSQVRSDDTVFYIYPNHAGAPEAALLPVNRYSELLRKERMVEELAERWMVSEWNGQPDLVERYYGDELQCALKGEMPKPAAWAQSTWVEPEPHPVYTEPRRNEG